MKKQEKIESVGRGEYAWHNDGTVEQLREVIKMSFPNVVYVIDGHYKFYHACQDNFEFLDLGDTTDLPSHSVKDFFNVDESEIKIGDRVEWQGCTVEVMHIIKDLVWVKSKISTTGCVVYLTSLKKVKTQDQKDREKIEELMKIGTSSTKFALDLIKYAREK